MKMLNNLFDLFLRRALLRVVGTDVDDSSSSSVMTMSFECWLSSSLTSFLTIDGIKFTGAWLVDKFTQKSKINAALLTQALVHVGIDLIAGGGSSVLEEASQRAGNVLVQDAVGEILFGNEHEEWQTEIVGAVRIAGLFQMKLDLHVVWAVQVGW